MSLLEKLAEDEDPIIKEAVDKILAMPIFSLKVMIKLGLGRLVELHEFPLDLYKAIDPFLKL